MKKRILSLLCVLALCLGLLPVTALAAAEGAPDKLYVGNQSVRNGDNTTYWTTNDSGELTQSNENGTWNVKYDPNTATLTLNEAKISGSYDENNNPFTAGIYAKGSSNQAVALTIELIGTNTITGRYGIYLDGHQGNTICTNASVLIKNGNESGESGSLTVNGTGSHGIYILSGTGNASLTIENASVVANATSSYSGSGVCVQSGASSNNSPVLSLAVNGGSLTTSGSASGEGIKFYVGAFDAASATTSLTVTDNAIVDARTGGISADGVNITPIVNIGSTGSTGGIVFDGTEGTVYGDVTLDEPVTIDQGETLTIPEGSTLNGNSNLTNNGTVTIENGGTLNSSDAINNTGTINVENGGNLGGTPTGGTVVKAPAIITESPLPEGTVGTEYNQTLAAENNPTSWSVTSGTLPAGLMLNSDGTITGTPSAEGSSTFTVKAENSAGSTSKEYTLNIKPATVSVTGVTLDKTALSLVTGGSDTLTATVEPGNATNQAVTWTSSDNNVAAVDTNGKVTAVGPGSATITVTTADGGFTASCTVTVTQPVTGVTLDKTALSLVTGGSDTLTATVEPGNATNRAVTWTSDKPEVATVDTDGKVTAVGPGSATITVKTVDGGKTATCTVTVTQPVTGVTLDKTTLSLFTGDSATLTAIVQPANATNKTVNWVSSNPAVATVDGSGHVKAVAAGTANITATTTDRNKTAVCAVTVTGRTYALSSAPGAIAFGNVTTGYTPPAAQVVVIQNTGNQPLNLTQPKATNFGVGKLSETALKPGETATFIVQPKAGLGAGSYKETLTISGDGGAKATVNLSFVVQAPPAATATATPAPTPLEMHTLHFDTNGGLPMEDVKFGLGAPVELWPYTPVRVGYLFQGWYSDQALTKAVGTIVLVKDTTIYAKWAPDPAAAVQSGSTGSGSGSGSGSKGGSTAKATPTPTPAPTATPEPTPTPTATPEATEAPIPTIPPQEEEDQGSFPVVPVAAGVIVLVVLVGGIAIYRRFHD